MAYNTDIARDHLLARFTYDSDSGLFTWRDGPRAGLRAGRTLRSGYVEIKVDGTTYSAHRLAWLYVHGSWPPDQIDHIDGTRSNNAISNLRLATAQENAQNMCGRRTNSSGFLGVTHHRKLNRWQAQIRSGGKLTYLGVRDTPEEAYALYREAKSALHSFNPVPR